MYSSDLVGVWCSCLSLIRWNIGSSESQSVMKGVWGPLKCHTIYDRLICLAHTTEYQVA